MEYRRFGRTGLQMPVFSCGGMRFQYKWQDVPLGEVPPENQANLEATVRRAVELGINHMETARGYGSSERQLGLILPKLPREKLIVQTKIVSEKDPRKFTGYFEESLWRLQLPYVDLLALHGINDQETLDWAIGPKGVGNGCLAAARKLQQRGLVRHIGFSTHAPTRIILDAIRHERDGGFDYVNLHWYYIFQKNWPAIEEATQRDMGVFIISPADKGGKLYAPPPKLVDLCAPLHPLVFNNLFCLSHPQVHTLSIGAARPTDLDLHMEALPHLSKAQETIAPIVARLDAALRQVMPPILRQPLALDLPEWQDAPGQINLPILLWLLSLVKAFDMTDYAQMRYNLLGSGGHWFPGQNAAQAEHLDLSSVAKRAGLDGKLLGLLNETHALLGTESVKRLSQS